MHSKRTALQVASICRLAQPREGAAIRLPRKALRTDGSSIAGLAPQLAAGIALEVEHVAGRADRQVAMAADMLSRGCCNENALARGAQMPSQGLGVLVPQSSDCGLSRDWCLISSSQHSLASRLSRNGLRVRFLDDCRAAGQGALRPPHLQRAERPPRPQRSQVPGAIG